MGTYTEGKRQQKQQALTKAIPTLRSLDTKTQSQGNMMNTHGLL